MSSVSIIVRYHSQVCLHIRLSVSSCVNLCINCVSSISSCVYIIICVSSVPIINIMCVYNHYDNDEIDTLP